MADKKTVNTLKTLKVDARTMTPDELQDELLKLKKEQFNLRFQAATGQLQNTARVQQVRRSIALVKTLMREKGLAAIASAEQV